MTISVRLFFHVYSNVYLVGLEENYKFMIKYCLQPNSFYLKLLIASSEMSETSVYLDVKRDDYRNKK